MTATQVDRFIRRAQASALIVLPVLFVLVFAMHFRRASDFLHFRAHYEPADPHEVVAALIRAGNRLPLAHDPHVLAYLSLPLLLLCAFGLYRIGRSVRPLAAALTLAITATGTIYLGGLFGMWTAFYRGLGAVDPQYLEGAVATFAAQSAPRGAFELTTLLSRLAFLGLALQMATLARQRLVPDAAIIASAAGAGIILVFADLDNWMLLGSVLMLLGFIPAARALRNVPEAGAA
jgi:hypothetical protein